MLGTGAHVDEATRLFSQYKKAQRQNHVLIYVELLKKIIGKLVVLVLEGSGRSF